MSDKNEIEDFYIFKKILLSERVKLLDALFFIKEKFGIDRDSLKDIVLDVFDERITVHEAMDISRFDYKGIFQRNNSREIEELEGRFLHLKAVFSRATYLEKASFFSCKIWSSLILRGDLFYNFDKFQKGDWINIWEYCAHFDDVCYLESIPETGRLLYTVRDENYYDIVIYFPGIQYFATSHLRHKVAK